jgi:hypothetical protein
MIKNKAIETQHFIRDQDHTEKSRVLPDTYFNLSKMETRRKRANDRQGAEHDSECTFQNHLQPS